MEDEGGQTILCVRVKHLNKISWKNKERERERRERFYESRVQVYEENLKGRMWVTILISLNLTFLRMVRDLLVPSHFGPLLVPY